MLYIAEELTDKSKEELIEIILNLQEDIDNLEHEQWD